MSAINFGPRSNIPNNDDEKKNDLEMPSEISIGRETTIGDLVDEETDDDDDDDDDEDFIGALGEGDIFQGWARVFFQGRNDKIATQILPSNSSVQSRDCYLFIEVNTKKQELSLFPSDDEKILLIKPPIKLNFFYAVKVPQSHCGVALFLKDDHRYYHRYLFRFEFRNDTIQRPSSQFNILQLYSNFLKKKRKEKKKKIAATVAFLENNSEASVGISEQKLQEAGQAYINGISELLENAARTADLFVESVNFRERNMKKYKYRTKFWGAGYRSSHGGQQKDDDLSSLDDDDDDDDDGDGFSNKSPEFDNSSYDSADMTTDGKKKTETIQQSFERMFAKKVGKYVIE